MPPQPKLTSLLDSKARRAVYRVGIFTIRYFVENLNTVFDLNASPGFKIVLGKSG